MWHKLPRPHFKLNGWAFHNQSTETLDKYSLLPLTIKLPDYSRTIPFHPDRYNAPGSDEHSFLAIEVSFALLSEQNL